MRFYFDYKRILILKLNLSGFDFVKIEKQLKISIIKREYIIFLLKHLSLCFFFVIFLGNSWLHYSTIFNFEYDLLII
jgi:hypothetical protein